jgi:plastocyanin
VTRASRREFLKAGSLTVAGFGLLPTRRATASPFERPPSRRSAPNLEIIEMRSDTLGSRVWFDPVGLYVEPGTTVRWLVLENVHTTAAYHPRNDRHPLRIPEGALPWDSGFLVDQGDRFEVTLTIPGVYDYYCAPHEAAGMVGRIVVGTPLGPGIEPFDYWVGRPGTNNWRHVPSLARETFPCVARILTERRVHPTKRSE